MSEVESSFESADAILERIQNGPPPAKPPSEVQKEREEKCLQSVINNFEYTIGTIFVKKYFDVSVKRKVGVLEQKYFGFSYIVCCCRMCCVVV